MATNKDFRVKNGLVVEQDANIGGNLVVTGTITGDGSGLSGVTSYTQTDFDNDFATKSTTDLAEGTNLYYTDARFDAQLATKDTDDVAEGTSNLYYTTTRANSDFDSRLTLKSTSDLTEGTNLYYTTTRANTDFDTRLATKSTSNLIEGANLYYTDSRVGAYLATNNYATESYVGTQISNLVDSSPATLDTLNELAAALGDDPNFATTVATSIGTKWTQDNTKISNWDTAYGWGDHASAGYASESSVVKLTGDQTVDGTKTFSSNPILSGGTANGVPYLNGSKVLTTGSNLTYGASGLYGLVVTSGALSALELKPAGGNVTVYQKFTNSSGTAWQEIAGTSSGWIFTNKNQTGAISFITTATGGATTQNLLMDSNGITQGATAFTANPALGAGTINGVAYLNGSKVLTTSSALTFNGTNLGIGDASPSYKLQVAGDIYATGNVTAYSDRTLKDNIKTVGNALELVSQMRGVTYTRKDTGEAGVGVIAQEMQEVLPEVVMNKDGVMGVAYGNIVGVLIEAIKEQQKQIDDLKQKLSENK